MSHKQQTLEEFSRQAAEHMGDGPSAEERQAQKDAILRNAVAATKRSRANSKGWRVGFAIAASIAVVLAFVSLWRGGPRPINYWVGNEQVASSSGRWIKAHDHLMLPVRFENGDNLELTRNSALRIIESNTEEISVALDSGKLTARVNKEPGTKFSVKAGPYWIYDIGTIFSVDWSPELLALEVRVEEGLVQIVGSNLSGQGIQVAAGGVYQYPSDASKTGVAIGARPSAPSPTESVVQDTTPDESRLLEGEEAESPAVTTPPKRKRRGTRRTSNSESTRQGATTTVEEAPESEPVPAPAPWALYLSRGEYSEALKAAKDDDLDAVALKLSEGELWRLSQVARYARDGKSAKRLLQYYRERFAQNAKSKSVAFLLGRVELELLSSPSAAAQWFETYLEDAPGGDFSEEALGRLMQVYGRMGSASEEERTARLYLRKYPGGLYKRLASSILNE